MTAGARGAARRFLFASAAFDERTLELQVGGEPVELEPKPLEVLRHLLLHAGEVVTKDEVLAAVWPGRILSETVLTKCVARLREVLRDQDQQIIKTVHGYGYRLLAAVRVEFSAPATIATRFDFKPGDHPPLRPLWSLVRSLGQGSFGEAWLVQHDKTREQRVFKFATDATALQALKREITLYRLLHDALGDHAPCIEALDWNLVEAPYFLELEYAAGGSLVDWAKAHNGLLNVSMAVRLEVAAQAAETLSAAHSMGVLHKDLKPSNILVVSGRESPVAIRLGDFGSGSVLDPARLEAMGITRMGFTMTFAAGMAGGTPLYLAPEVLAGQPATVQADIYALGVVLYQLIVGDLYRPLAPGWEHDIEDELLREDIAYAVEGHVERRLGAAGMLARRLRTLGERRQQRAAEKAAKDEARSQRMEMQRVLARRGWVRATMAVLAVGLTASLILSGIAFQARNAADESAATSAAVSDFLSQDMFAQISSNKPLRNLTVKEVVDAAAAKVPGRFAGKPVAEARVHAALGASYLALDAAAEAERELDTALALALQHEPPGSETAMEAVTHLIIVKLALGKYSDVEATYQRVLEDGQSHFGPQHPGVLRLRARQAEALTYSGQQQLAAERLRGILADAAHATPPDPVFLATARSALGNALLWLADYAEAATLFAEIIPELERQLGPQHANVARAHMRLAAALLYVGKYAEAESHLAKALAGARNWSPSDAHATVMDIRIQQGILWAEQGRLEDAARELRSVRDLQAAWAGPELDQSFTSRMPLAEVLQRQGQLAEAEAEARHALAAASGRYGPKHERVLRAHILLADILRSTGKPSLAWQQIEQVAAAPELMQFPKHPLLADLRRVEGLLHLYRKDSDKARIALAAARDIVEFRRGPAHWRSERARRELAQAAAPAVD